MLEMVGIMWECYGMLSLHDLWCILPPELLEAKLGKWRIPSVIKIFLKINGLPQHWAIWIQGVPCNAKKISGNLCVCGEQILSALCIYVPKLCSAHGIAAPLGEWLYAEKGRTPKRPPRTTSLNIFQSPCHHVAASYLQVIHVFLDSNSKLMPFAFKGCCSFVGSVNQVKKKSAAAAERQEVVLNEPWCRLWIMRPAAQRSNKLRLGEKIPLLRSHNWKGAWLCAQGAWNTRLAMPHAIDSYSILYIYN